MFKTLIGFYPGSQVNLAEVPLPPLSFKDLGIAALGNHPLAARLIKLAAVKGASGIEITDAELGLGELRVHIKGSIASQPGKPDELNLTLNSEPATTTQLQAVHPEFDRLIGLSGFTGTATLEAQVNGSIANPLLSGTVGLDGRWNASPLKLSIAATADPSGPKMTAHGELQRLDISRLPSVQSQRSALLGLVHSLGLDLAQSDGTLGIGRLEDSDLLVHNARLEWSLKNPLDRRALNGSVKIAAASARTAGHDINSMSGDYTIGQGSLHISQGLATSGSRGVEGLISGSVRLDGSSLNLAINLSPTRSMLRDLERMVEREVDRQLDRWERHNPGTRFMASMFGMFTGEYEPGRRADHEEERALRQVRRLAFNTTASGSLSNPYVAEMYGDNRVEREAFREAHPMIYKLVRNFASLLGSILSLLP